jgi:hypothetical protein
MCRRPPDQLSAGLVALERVTVDDELSGERPPVVDLGAHDPAAQQPVISHVTGRPPGVGIALIEPERQHESLAPLQPHPSVLGLTDPKRAGQVLALQGVEPAGLDLLEPRFSMLADQPVVDGHVSAAAERLGFLSEHLLSQPGHPAA